MTRIRPNGYAFLHRKVEVTDTEFDLVISPLVRRSQSASFNPDDAFSAIVEAFSEAAGKLDVGLPPTAAEARNEIATTVKLAEKLLGRLDNIDTYLRSHLHSRMFQASGDLYELKRQLEVILLVTPPQKDSSNPWIDGLIWSLFQIWVEHTEDTSKSDTDPDLDDMQHHLDIDDINRIYNARLPAFGCWVMVLVRVFERPLNCKLDVAPDRIRQLLAGIAKADRRKTDRNKAKTPPLKAR